MPAKPARRLTDDEAAAVGSLLARLVMAAMRGGVPIEQGRQQPPMPKNEAA
jgi:hypothetical protein